MKALPQRRSYPFDARSVMLFAALSLGAVAALHAQTGSGSPAMTMSPADKSAPASRINPEPVGASAARPASPATTAAFDRADANRDGQLSMQEAAQLPAIGQRFKELDADRNGALSRAEFEKGANS